MDPYLERFWGDIHNSIIFLSKQAIQTQLGGSLVARSEDRVYVDDEDGVHRQIRIPDVRIVEQGIRDVPLFPAAGGIAVAEPTVITIESDDVTESYIQIIDTALGGRVVTVIEFLSPSNKTTKAGRKSYEDKQGEWLESRTNMVEVDLIRTGRRKLLVDMFEIPSEKRGEYLVSVYRAYAGRHGRREGYGLKLRERLPGIRIPLRDGDPDIALDLQSVLDQAYDAGAYGRTLDYTHPLDPALNAADADWAAGLIAARQ
jgi:hypothetical protein